MLHEGYFHRLLCVLGGYGVFGRGENRQKRDQNIIKKTLSKATMIWQMEGWELSSPEKINLAFEANHSGCCLMFSTLQSGSFESNARNLLRKRGRNLHPLSNWPSIYARQKLYFGGEQSVCLVKAKSQGCVHLRLCCSHVMMHVVLLGVRSLHAHYKI